MQSLTPVREYLIKAVILKRKKFNRKREAELEEGCKNKIKSYIFWVHHKMTWQPEVQKTKICVWTNR